MALSGVTNKIKECFIMSELSSSPRTSTKSALDVRTIACTGMLCAVAYAVLYFSKTVFAGMAVAGFL